MKKLGLSWELLKGGGDLIFGSIIPSFLKTQSFFNGKARFLAKNSGLYETP